MPNKYELVAGVRLTSHHTRPISSELGRHSPQIANQTPHTPTPVSSPCAEHQESRLHGVPSPLVHLLPLPTSAFQLRLCRNTPKTKSQRWRTTNARCLGGGGHHLCCGNRVKSWVLFHLTAQNSLLALIFTCVTGGRSCAHTLPHGRVHPSRRDRPSGRLTRRRNSRIRPDSSGHRGSACSRFCSSIWSVMSTTDVTFLGKLILSSRGVCPRVTIRTSRGSGRTGELNNISRD